MFMLILVCGYTFSSRVQIFYEQVLSLQDSLTAGSLIITVSRGKPCWLARYKCKGWSLCCQLVQFSKGNDLF